MANVAVHGRSRAAESLFPFGTEVIIISLDGGRTRLCRNLSASKPIIEIKIKITVAISTTIIAGAIAGGKGGGIRLVRSVAVKRGSGSILDINF